jgi:hypothetical protein
MELSEGDISPNYVSKTDDEIKELAKALYRGEIFTSLQVPEHSMHLLTSIFMPLAFLDVAQRRQLIENGAYCFYANMSDAGPRAINGFPIFFSLKYLNKEDSLRLLNKYDAIKKALDDV